MKVLSTFTNGDDAIRHAKALYNECDGKHDYAVLKCLLTSCYDIVKIEKPIGSFTVSTKIKRGTDEIL